MPADGERLPLRSVPPSRALASVTAKSKRSQVATSSFVSPLQPRASLFGVSASDAFERSTAPTVAPPANTRLSQLSPIGQLSPPFALPLAMPLVAPADPVFASAQVVSQAEVNPALASTGSLPQAVVNPAFASAAFVSQAPVNPVFAPAEFASPSQAPIGLRPIARPCCSQASHLVSSISPLEPMEVAKP
jgi:hypothetical protein